MPDLKFIADYYAAIIDQHEHTLQRLQTLNSEGSRCTTVEDVEELRRRIPGFRQFVAVLRRPDVTHIEALAALEAACRKVEAVNL
jgi:hypothetical protein